MYRKYQMFSSGPATRLLTWLRAVVMVAAFLLSHTMTAHAFPATQCVADRFGSNLNCTANDVSVTNIRVIGDTTSCVGGTSITLDLELTVNFGSANRFDIGVFVSNDGKTGTNTSGANGGAASCSVAVLPITSPFQNLDSDTCGDGGGSLSGILYMPGVTLACQSIGGAGGNLYIPYVVSWDHQSTRTCNTANDALPGGSAKCNAPTIAQGTVGVIVLPTITNTDGKTFVNSGDTVTYTVVITNTTGVTLSGAVFTDPAVTNINVSSVTCSASGGATCPAATVAAMQGAGITIPNMPANGSVTFTITATLAGTPPDTLTNTASVTVNSQAKSVSDTDTVVGAIAITPSSLSKYGIVSAWVPFNYTLRNFASSDTISLSALSGNGWTVQIRNASDTGTISSLTVPAGGSADFIVKVLIDGGATIGVVDVTTITATSGNDPTKKATATAVTTVSGPFTFTPNNTGAGGKGSSVFYDHRVQNNTALSTGVTFGIVLSGDCGGWSAAVYKADRVTQIPPGTVTLGPFGGYEDIAVKVNIPAVAATGTSCTATVTATAGGNSAPVTDATTVKDLVLYSDPGYTDESYIFPAGNSVYARAFGTLATNYNFFWIDPAGNTRRTSPVRTGPGTLPDAYDIPANAPLGTWHVEVRNSVGAVFTRVDFYVGPDHLQASYTGTNPVNVNTPVTIDLTLHGRNHLVPLDSVTGNVVQGSPATKDPLKITVTVSGAATILGTSGFNGPVAIVGQTVTGVLSNVTGTASITITSSANGTVTITPASFNSALAGSPARDETTTVTFVNRRMRILYWREMY